MAQIRAHNDPHRNAEQPSMNDALLGRDAWSEFADAKRRFLARLERQSTEYCLAQFTSDDARPSTTTDFETLAGTRASVD